jgi:hypothetical protein
LFPLLIRAPSLQSRNVTVLEIRNRIVAEIAASV